MNPTDVLGIGLNATDTLLLVREFPPYAGKVPFYEELLSPGGQVATAIVACARLGLRTRYIGTLGDDLRGQIQLESLAEIGVDTASLIIRPGCANQTAYIIIDDRTGERTVLWQRSDTLRLQPCEINKDDIVSARLLHIDGYDVEAAAYAARIARAHSIPVSLDVDTLYPDFASVLENVDYLVASSSWPAKFTGEHDPFVALSSLQREFDFAVAAMTLGDYGSLALFEGRWYYSPAFGVPCVDTTGAGDVFHGAFCCAMLHGYSMQSVLDFSNAAAALNCEAVGARGNVPYKAAVDELLSAAEQGVVKRHVDDELAERLAGVGVAAARS